MPISSRVQRIPASSLETDRVFHRITSLWNIIQASATDCWRKSEAREERPRASGEFAQYEWPNATSSWRRHIRDAADGYMGPVVNLPMCI